LESTIKSISIKEILNLTPYSFWVFIKLYFCPKFKPEELQLKFSLAELNKIIGVSSRDFKNCLDELEQKNLIRLVHNAGIIKRGCSPKKVTLSGEVKEFLAQNYDEKSLADIQKVLAFENSNDSRLMIKEKALLLYCLLIKDSVAMSEKYIKKAFDVNIKCAHEKFGQYNFNFRSVNKIDFDNGSLIFRIEKKNSHRMVMQRGDKGLLVVLHLQEPDEKSEAKLEYEQIIIGIEGVTGAPSLNKLSTLIRSYFEYYRMYKMEGAEEYIVREMGHFGFISDRDNNREFIGRLRKDCKGFDAKTRDRISDEAGLKLIIKEKYSVAENTQFRNYILALKKSCYSDAYLKKIAKSVVKLIFKREHYESGDYFFRAVCDFYVLLLKRLEERLSDDFYKEGLKTIHVNDDRPVFFNVCVYADVGSIKLTRSLLFQNKVFKI
jgi:hypothetical protein